ncbi:hypothetical protein [Entomospira culicis]|uniref:Uncharacterized protein n=1 Tax=Entomospira culicis TaxID=2719989 RepID=A0A968GJX6_9SPIO|nr:hypothetical protein [Entomospira culicis]NIZ19851.1 hypothetical protein [Entomospira culicis]NIZ70065.1 hypothetical protein [Entomospira culicis]WDI37169.1 hypothetical protein PVA46_07570 [Entomospira culicis]WDI38798.1 hypothetical protein PVA47_07580 [Entomospira culicis]
MMFVLEREKATVAGVALSDREYQYQVKKTYQDAPVIGRPPHFTRPSAKEVHDVQPFDLLQAEGAEALENISYNQEQLDFLHHHALSLRQALSPVISAFTDTPQDMGIVMNFCT